MVRILRILISIAVGDFNGDGKLDLAVANSGNGTVSVLLGNGNGTFATDTTYSTGGTTPEAVAVGDFNKDGIPIWLWPTRAAAPWACCWATATAHSRRHDL